MNEPDSRSLAADERPDDGVARQEPLIVARIAKWLLFSLIGLTIVLIAAWPFRVDLINRFGPGIASHLLGVEVTFVASRADFDRVELRDVTISNGPAAQSIVLERAANPTAHMLFQRIQIDGLRLGGVVRESGFAITGLEFPNGADTETETTIPVRNLILSDLHIDIESPVGESRLTGDIDMTFPSAPSLFPISGRISLEDRVSNSALLAEFDTSADGFTATGTADLSLRHWLPLVPQIASAQGRATARFELTMLASSELPTPQQVGGDVEIAWTAAKVTPRNQPELVLADGLLNLSTDGTSHSLHLPQPIEITGSQLPSGLLAWAPDLLRPYLTGMPQLVLTANSDEPALIIETASDKDAATLTFDLTAAMTVGPIAVETEPAILTLGAGFAPTTAYIRRSNLSLLRGVDLPRDLAAHLEIGAVELDIAAYLNGMLPAVQFSYAMEGTLAGTIIDPLWVRWATFRGEGLASLHEGMTGLNLGVEPGGQLRADGVTGTGDLRLSPDIRVDVAGRDPLSLTMSFRDLPGTLAAKGTFRLGEVSIALPDGDGRTSVRFSRQPVAINYADSTLSFVFGPTDITSPDLDIAANRSVIRARLTENTGKLSFRSEELVSDGRVFAPGPAVADLSFALEEAGGVVAEGPVSLSGGAVSALLSVHHSGASPVQTKIDLHSEPVRFGDGGVNLSDILPSGLIGGSDRLPDLLGQVSARVKAIIRDGAISGDLTFDMDNLAIDAPEGALRGLNGPLNFDLATFPATQGVHELTATAHLPGIEAIPVSARFGIEPDGRIAIEEAILSVFGGSIALIDAKADPAGNTLNGTIRLRRISLRDAMALIDIEGVEASGSVSGVIPIDLDGSDAVIQGGSIGSEGSGVLKIDNPSVNQALASDEETVQLMTEVLKDFHYDSLTAEIELPPDRNGRVLLSLGGRNPAVLEGHPFRLNVSLESDFRNLFNILQQVMNLSSDILGRRSGG